MKKTMISILCMVLLLFSLCSCTGTGTAGSQTSSQTGSDSIESTVSSAKEDEVVELVWWRYNTKECPDENTVHDAINEYLAAHNLYVTIKHPTSEYQTLIQNSLAAREEIDIMWGNINNINSYLQMNAVMDLSSFIDDYPKLKASIPDNVWEAVTRPTGLFAIPCYKESAVGCSLAVPTEMVEKYDWDFSAVKSIKDMEPFFEALMNDSNVKYVYWPTYIQQFRTGGAYPIIDEIASVSNYLGVNVSNPEELIVVPEDEDYIANVELMQKYVEKGYIHPDNLTVSMEQESWWKSGQLAFADWSTVPDQEANASERYGMPITIVDLTDQYLTNYSALGSAYEICNYSEKVDSALKFLELLYTDQELADLVLFGIEGTHYTRTSEGLVEKIGNSGYDYDAWVCVNVMTPSLMTAEAEDKKEQYADFNANAKSSVLLGFHLDESKISAEIAALNAVVSTYQKTVEWGFETSDITREKYVEALYDAGLQTVLDEARTQYDTWYKNK